MSYAEHLLDIYGVHLHLATTKKSWRKIAKAGVLDATKRAPQAAGQVSSGLWQPKVGNAAHVVVIWIDVKNHTDPGELIDSCAHEASHAAGRILEHAGHTVEGTDEPSAYLCGWLTRWIWEHCA